MATKMRRFLAILMALTLCASLVAVPAMAAEVEEAAPAAESVSAPAAAPAAAPASAPAPAAEPAPAPAAEPAPAAAPVATPVADAAPAAAPAAAPEVSVAPVAEVVTPDAAPAAVEVTVVADSDAAMGPGGHWGGGNHPGGGGQGGSTPNENTSVDHIDINVNAGGTIILNGEEQNVSVTVDKDDAPNVTITNNGMDGYDDFEISGDIGTSTDANGDGQIRIEGSFDIGTQENPTSYTVELVKDVTVGEGEEAIDITVTLSTTTDYWDLENLCPPLWSGDTPNENWQDGQFIGGTGIDLRLEPSGSGGSGDPTDPTDPSTPGTPDVPVTPTTGQLTIQKTIVGIDGLQEDMQFYFDVTDENGNVVYDDIAVTVSSGNTVGLLIIENVELGTYTVIEIIDERSDIDGYDLSVEDISYVLDAAGTTGNTVVLTAEDDEGYVGVTNVYIPEETEPVETDPIETDPVETDPVETDPIETDPVETDPVETDPVETDPVETDPVETDPVETDPVETDPVETDPVETEPVETEPVETEPVETDPVETEPVETDPVETDPVETDPIETDPVETDPVETDPVETDPVETDPVETDPIETDPVETEPVETEPVETEPVETDPVETDPEETEPEETIEPPTKPAVPGEDDEPTKPTNPTKPTKPGNTPDAQDDDFPIDETEELEDDLVAIPDEDVPLANVPKTGDISLIWAVLSGLSAGGLMFLNKKRED